MTRNIYAFALLLLLMGGAFAGTIVGVGETVEVSSTGAVVESDGAEDTDEYIAPLPTQATVAVSSEDAPDGGFVMTKESGEAITISSEGMMVQAVKVSTGKIEVMQEHEGEYEVMYPYEVSAAGQPEIVAVAVESPIMAMPIEVEIMSTAEEVTLTTDGASVSTVETLLVKEQKLYVQEEGTNYEIKVLPIDIESVESKDFEVQKMELKVEESKPVYELVVKEKRNFLFIIPVESESTVVVDAQNAEIISESGPWWAFVAPPVQSATEIFSEISNKLVGTP